MPLQQPTHTSTDQGPLQEQQTAQQAQMAALAANPFFNQMMMSVVGQALLGGSLGQNPPGASGTAFNPFAGFNLFANTTNPPASSTTTQQQNPPTERSGVASRKDKKKK